jgi:hypothetical protein
MRVLARAPQHQLPQRSFHDAIEATGRTKLVMTALWKHEQSVLRPAVRKAARQIDFTAVNRALTQWSGVTYRLEIADAVEGAPFERERRAGDSSGNDQDASPVDQP